MPSVADIVASLTAQYAPTQSALNAKKAGYEQDTDYYLNSFQNDHKLYDSSYWYKKPEGFGWSYELTNAGKNKRDKIHTDFFNSVAASRDSQDAEAALSTAGTIADGAGGLANSIYSAEQDYLSGAADTLAGYKQTAMQDLMAAAARSGQLGRSFEKTQRARIGNIYNDAVRDETQAANAATNAHVGSIANVFGDYFDQVLSSEQAGDLDGASYGSRTSPNKVNRGVYASDYWLTKEATTGDDAFSGIENSFNDYLGGIQGVQYQSQGNPFENAVPGAKLFQMASQAARRDPSNTGASPIDYLRNPRIRQRYKLFG